MSATTFDVAEAGGVTLGILHHPDLGYLVLPGNAPGGPRFSPFEAEAYFGTVSMLRTAAANTACDIPDLWEIIPVSDE